MKKLLLSAVMGLSIFTAVPTAQAEEKLDFDQLVYPTTTENQYTSLGYWDYIFGLTDGTVKDRGFSHIKLTNGNYYDYWDYIFALADKKVFAEALKEVDAKSTALDLAVVPGKPNAAGKIVPDSDAAAPEFKVIDIK